MLQQFFLILGRDLNMSTMIQKKNIIKKELDSLSKKEKGRNVKSVKIIGDPIEKYMIKNGKKTFVGFMCHVMVQLKHVLIDTNYQRNEMTNHVKSIVKDFKPLAARPLALSLRSNKLYAYDGQQTRRALMDIGYKEWEGTVIIRPTFKEECELFYILNTSSKKVSNWENYRAAILKGSKKHKMALEIAEGHGFTTPLVKKGSKYTVDTSLDVDITNCKFLTTAYSKGKTTDDEKNRGNYYLLDQLLMLINHCWRNENGKIQTYAQNAKFISGLLIYLKDHREDFDDIQAVMEGIDSAEIRIEASRQKSKSSLDANQYALAFKSIMRKSRRRAA